MRRIATATGVGTLAVLLLLLPAAANAAFGPASSFGSSGSANGFFSHPQSAAVNFGNGDIYVADTGNARVQRFNSAGVWQSKFAGASGFSPQDVAVDPTNGNVYVASPNRIEGFTSGGLPIPLASWAPAGTAYGITIDSNGVVYVSDTQNSNIHKYSALGTDLGTFSGFGSAGGQVVQPKGLTTRSSQNGDQILVADPSNNRVEAFTTSGAFLKQWTMPSYTVNTPGGTFSGVVHPQDVAVDGSGRVFAPDSGTHSNLVAVLGADGSTQQLFGAPDSDPANVCQVSSPWGIATSPSGNLYVVSTGENRVRVFNESSSACPAPGFGQPIGVGPGAGGSGGAAGALGNGKPQISFTGFPSSRCVRRNFIFQIHLQDESRIAKMLLFVNHHRVATQTPNEQFWNVKVRMPIRALRRAIPAGSRLRIVVVVKAIDYTGLKSKARHAFTVCA